MATMRAAFFEAARTLTVRETDIPEPRPGEVLLRVRYCGICGSDLTVYKTGVLSGPRAILGHEVSAAVESDPSGTWERGARVTYYPTPAGCGQCAWCTDGKPRYCTAPPPDATRHGGGYARFVVVPAGSVLPVPPEVGDREAAMAEPLGVALRGVAMAGPVPGSLAYVQGLGPIGLFAVAGLVAAGCRVIGADPREDRRDLALDQGAEEVFDPTREEPLAVALRAHAKGPRIAFECSGAPEALEQVLDACGAEGVVAILGIPVAPALLLRMTLKDLRAFSIQGPTMDSMRAALALLRDRPQVARIATGEVGLEGTGKAFDALIDGGGGAKVLVNPWA